MQMSGNALAQLHVLTTETGTFKGSLLHLIDCTLSPFGCRHLRTWLTHPLTNTADIEDRQDSVANLLREDCVSFLLDLQVRLCRVQLVQVTLFFKIPGMHEDCVSFLIDLQVRLCRCTACTGDSSFPRSWVPIFRGELRGEHPTTNYSLGWNFLY